MQPLTEGAAVDRSTLSPAAPTQRPRQVTELVALVAIIALPIVSNDLFLIDRFGQYFLLAVFAISVDLIWGYGGMFTFGHAAFFGGGGYAVGMLTTRSGWILPLPFAAAILVAVVASALLALALSFFVFYGQGALRGVEFAVVTLAVAVLAERLARAGGSVTGGQNGILMDSRLGIPGVISLHRGYGFYFVTVTLLVATYAGVRVLLASRPGLILRAIRGNEERADLLGYDVPAVKRRTFMLSGAIAGLAGALFYVHAGIVSPSTVGVGSSTLVLLWVVLGGRGTLLGPVVGAIALPHLTASLSGTLLDRWLLVVGVILVAVIVLFPSGIFGFLNREQAQWTS